MYLEEDIVLPYIKTSLSSDEYLHSPYWKASLSDGRVAYSDVNRRSWLELKSYLEVNPDKYITRLEFFFRDHDEVVVEGNHDYFFTHSILCNDSGWYKEYYIGGYRDGDSVKCFKYMIPEIYFVEEEKRSLQDHSVIRGLIKRNFRENNHSCKQTSVSTE